MSVVGVPCVKCEQYMDKSETINGWKYIEAVNTSKQRGNIYVIGGWAQNENTWNVNQQT